MKHLYTGPAPRIPELLGKLYAFSATVLVFSTLLPILYPLLTVYATLAYLADKWYLLRICCKPTPYGCELVHATLWWVQYALVFKLLLAIWAYGSMPGQDLAKAIDVAFASFTGK